MSTRAEDSAGSRPKPTPAASAIASVIASTRKSSWQLNSCGVGEGTGRDDIAWVIPKASAMPATPPAKDRSTLSVRNCRMRRGRLAPTDKRMAISRLRWLPRASSRLARFTQTNERTSAHRTTLNVFTKACCSGVMYRNVPAGISRHILPLPSRPEGTPYSRSRLRVIVSIVASATGIVTPGASRSTTRKISRS